MIFTDIPLSGEMDGIDFAHEVKIRWPHLVVILISGNAGEHLKQMPPGVDYIPKPWQPLARCPDSRRTSQIVHWRPIVSGLKFCPNACG